MNQTTSHPALGIDHGDARIGIAATDDFGIMAHPIATIGNADPTKALDQILEIISTRKIQTLVIGLPLRMDGSEGNAVKKVRRFAKQLSTRTRDLPIHFTDESFTTADAASKLQQAGKKAHQQKAIIDQAAAVEILNRWMQELA